ncbi:unnamed protein product [Macrosiphum euphorbiae]|uniref:Secreted protein n=1 Tax=Macrosiphum euphorbiae TaxID=13131 RepID=A0AAV0VQH8_9HEMI|nr:unnamed protein product [Macrosiphum euphorbiae]
MQARTDNRFIILILGVISPMSATPDIPYTLQITNIVTYHVRLCYGIINNLVDFWVKKTIQHYTMYALGFWTTSSTPMPK